MVATEIDHTYTMNGTAEQTWSVDLRKTRNGGHLYLSLSPETITAGDFSSITLNVRSRVRRADGSLTNPSTGGFVLAAIDLGAVGVGKTLCLDDIAADAAAVWNKLPPVFDIVMAATSGDTGTIFATLWEV